MAASYAGWLDRMHAGVDRLLQDARVAELDEWPALCQSCGDALESPAGSPLDRVQTAALASVLIGACWRLSEDLHLRRPRQPCDCGLETWRAAAALSLPGDSDPRRLFQQWSAELVSRFTTRHPLFSWAAAAQAVRADPGKRWTLAALARVAHASPKKLRHVFHAALGMTPLAYVQLVRAARSIALLGAGHKVEAAALEAGYRGKKDLYLILRRWAGVTPGDLRDLPPDERAWLERQLRLACFHGINGAGGGFAERAQASTRTFRQRAPLPSK